MATSAIALGLGTFATATAITGAAINSSKNKSLKRKLEEQEREWKEHTQKQDRGLKEKLEESRNELQGMLRAADQRVEEATGRVVKLENHLVIVKKEIEDMPVKYSASIRDLEEKLQSRMSEKDVQTAKRISDVYKLLQEQKEWNEKETTKAFETFRQMLTEQSEWSEEKITNMEVNKLKSEFNTFRGQFMFLYSDLVATNTAQETKIEKLIEDLENVKNLHYEASNKLEEKKIKLSDEVAELGDAYNVHTLDLQLVKREIEEGKGEFLNYKRLIEDMLKKMQETNEESRLLMERIESDSLATSAELRKSISALHEDISVRLREIEEVIVDMKSDIERHDKQIQALERKMKNLEYTVKQNKTTIDSLRK